MTNLVNIIARNHIQLSGKTKDIMPLENLGNKYLSFGWNVLEINGNNIKQIITACEKAKKAKKPTVIIANTIMGKGVSFIEDKYEWHGRVPTEEEAKIALKQLKKIKK